MATVLDAKRVRSPNYPQIGLSAAIANAKKVWDNVHKHPGSRDDIVGAMGYKGYNGASAGVLSALIKFGLLGRHGEDYRITALGRDILTLPEGIERAKAINEAANKPLLFNQLITHFEGAVPAHDNIIRTFLIRKDFSPNTVPQVIQGFRETFELVGREALPYDIDSTAEEEPEAMDPVAAQEVRPNPEMQPASAAAGAAVDAPAVAQGERQLLASQLSRSANCRILVSGPVGPRELRYLRKLLELQEEMLSAEDTHDIDEPRRDN